MGSSHAACTAGGAAELGERVGRSQLRRVRGIHDTTASRDLCSEDARDFGFRIKHCANKDVVNQGAAGIDGAQLQPPKRAERDVMSLIIQERMPYNNISARIDDIGVGSLHLNNRSYQRSIPLDHCRVPFVRAVHEDQVPCIDSGILRDLIDDCLFREANGDNVPRRILCVVGSSPKKLEQIIRMNPGSVQTGQCEKQPEQSGILHSFLESYLPAISRALCANRGRRPMGRSAQKRGFFALYP